MSLPSNKIKQTTFITFIVLILIYLGSYLFIRNSNVERWEKDQNDYVIYPQDKLYLYYLFRPLSYVDSKITGMRFHIGPHQ